MAKILNLTVIFSGQPEVCKAMNKKGPKGTRITWSILGSLILRKSGQ